MLRQSAIVLVPILGSGNTGGQMTASICPSGLTDNMTMMVNHFDTLLPLDPLAIPPNAASLENEAKLVENKAKHAQKLELRHKNWRNKRKNAPPFKHPEKLGFGFHCTLCIQVPSYFNRNGLLRHLWDQLPLYPTIVASSWSDLYCLSKSTHKCKSNWLNELNCAAIYNLLQPSKVTDDDFNPQVASYLDL